VGRRGVRPDQDERWVFNRLAEAYRSRPGYPEELVERLAKLAGGPGAAAVDLGAGTGHLALPLAEHGLAVTAVEPARAMREALAGAAREEGLAVEVVAAAAEETGLPGGGFDLAVVADALHWIDPDAGGREIARLLAPGGVAAVVEARPAETPFMDGLHGLLAAANPRARRKVSPRSPAQLFAPVAPGRAVAVERFRQEAALDDGALAAVLRSLSYVGPALGPDRLAEVIDEARTLATRTGGAVWARELRLSWVRRAGGGTGGPPPARAESHK
jgi:ubiquinone/menaquinone biosynthesis C-methylase UbiE